MMQKTLFSIIISSIFLACTDENVITDPNLTSLQPSRDHLIAESIFNDIERTIEKGFIDNGQSKNCQNYTIRNTNNNDEDTLIIDFGNGMPTCIDNGKIKKGKIITIFNGKYRDSLTIMRTIFDDHHINNNLIQGERVVRKEGRNQSGNIWFSSEVNNAVINTKNGAINWNASRTKEWVEGEETFYNPNDDKYIINGSANGQAVNGVEFMSTISQPLQINLSCFPYCITTFGETTVSTQNYEDRVISYGDSTCNCNVNIYTENNNYPVVIDLSSF